MSSSPSGGRLGVLTDPGSPLECALALAIPLSRSAFEDELERSPPRDFVFQITRGSAGILSRDALWEGYRPLAELAREVADAYSRSGADVVSPTWEGLAGAFRKSRVVTLFAHWKTADAGLPIPLDVQDVIEVLLTSGQPGPLIVRDAMGFAYLRDSLSALAEDGGGDEVAADLSARLHAVLAARGEHFSLPFRGEPVCQPSGRRIRFSSRAAQEFAAPGIYESSGRIELAGEMCSRERFLEAIPPSFQGLIDLALCHSRHLGDYVKAHRQCHVAMATNPVRARSRLMVQKGILKLLAAGGLSYAQCLVSIHEGLKRGT